MYNKPESKNITLLHYVIIGYSFIFLLIGVLGFIGIDKKVTQNNTTIIYNVDKLPIYDIIKPTKQLKSKDIYDIFTKAMNDSEVLKYNWNIKILDEYKAIIQLNKVKTFKGKNYDYCFIIDPSDPSTRLNINTISVPHFNSINHNGTFNNPWTRTEAIYNNSISYNIGQYYYKNEKELEKATKLNSLEEKELNSLLTFQELYLTMLI